MEKISKVQLIAALEEHYTYQRNISEPQRQEQKTYWDTRSPADLAKAEADAIFEHARKA